MSESLLYRRLFVPVLVGFAPAITIAITWGYGPNSHTNWLIKAYSLPILAIELMVIVVAMREGMSLRKIFHRLDPYLAAALCTVMAVAMTTAFLSAPAPATSILRTLIWIIHLAFGCSIMHLAAIRLFQPSDLASSMLAGFALSAMLLVLFVTGTPLPEDFDWIRDLPGVDHVRRYGYLAAAILGLCVGRLALPEHAAGRAQTLVVASMAFALVFWTGSRGAILAIAGAMAAGSILFPKLRSVRIWLSALATAVAGAILAHPIQAPHGSMGLERMIRHSAAGDGDVSSGRLDLWLETLQAIGQRPWFGFGEGQLAEILPHASLVQPHNVVLQMLLAWGLIGAAAATLLLVSLLAHVTRRTSRSGGEFLPLCLAANALAIYALVDGTLYHVQAAAIFAACAGAIASSRPYSADEEPQAGTRWRKVRFTRSDSSR